jgi:hypothetical protein
MSFQSLSSVSVGDTDCYFGSLYSAEPELREQSVQVTDSFAEAVLRHHGWRDSLKGLSEEDLRTRYRRFINKQWLCVAEENYRTRRVFLYLHDGEYRLVTQWLTS